MSKHSLDLNSAQSWFTGQLSNKTNYAVVAVLAAIVFSLFSQWEMSEESWGYWLFARVFFETGEFIIPGRSPLYTLYLNAFRWMGYPTSVNTEYIVTSLFVIGTLVFLFKRYMGLGLAVFAAILWIPFIQSAEPPVQKLALVCSCWAVMIRVPQGGRSRIAGSYGLLGLAFLFRTTYIGLLGVFLAWDVLQMARQGGAQRFLRVLRPRRADWPILLVLALSILPVTMQSSHPWNAASYATTTWFPNSEKSLANASFFQVFNNGYVRDKYGSFEGKDFYFTNQELFDGADNLIDAFRANPVFVATQTIRNIKRGIDKVPEITELSRLYEGLPRVGGLGSLPFYIVAISVMLAVLYGALRASRDNLMRVFVIGSVLMVTVTVAMNPKLRYMVPLIPVLVLSASWYGTRARTAIMAQRWSGNGVSRRWLSALALTATPVALIMFSNGATQWTSVAGGIVTDTAPVSVRAQIGESYQTFDSMVQDCRGVLSLEPTFVGAFMNIPLDRVYDIWEIPPFGNLDDSDYDGLRPDRIDCVLESERLANRTGSVVNIQIRYKNYVEPYIELLQDMGAATHEIPEYGRVIILQRG